MQFLHPYFSLEVLPMFRSRSPHTRAVLQALLVTFLWSTSWVLIKIGLHDAIPPLIFAGLRYMLALLCLLPLAFRQPEKHLAGLKTLSLRGWLRLLVLGLLFYTITQGAQFVGLANLPSITVNLLLSLTTVIVTLLGIAMLRERPTGVQWAGIAVYLIGVAIFFYPIAFPEGQIQAIMVVIGGVLANSAATVLGRAINRENTLSALAITVASMGVGAPVLLALGLLTQAMPALSLGSWLLIVWLAVMNTAFAFTLWNHTLRTLSAMESSIINNMMMVEIPVLAWLFLAEGIELKAGVGFALAGVGILIVQLRRAPQFKRSTAISQKAETTA
jgi:drug/metabolite transporter (DMT)-like permease